MQNEDSSGLTSGLRRTELAPNSRHSLNLPAGVKPYYIDEQSGIAIICADCREILPLLGELL